MSAVATSFVLFGVVAATHIVSDIQVVSDIQAIFVAVCFGFWAVLAGLVAILLRLEKGMKPFAGAINVEPAPAAEPARIVDPARQAEFEAAKAAFFAQKS